MKEKSICLMAFVAIFVASAAHAQKQESATVPRLVRFSGTVKDSADKPASGNVTLTFALYEDQEGGAALWLETQDVQVDGKGHYTVLLGANTGGLPIDVFVSGAARWLGVQPGLPGVIEQPRVLLVGVPYALKAADADTLGGKPASAFLLAGAAAQTPSPASASSIVIAGVTATSSSSPAPIQSQVSPTPNSLLAPPNCKSTGIQGGGVTGFISLWTGPYNTCAYGLGQSNIFQAPNGNLGIGNTSPAGPLDLTGNAFIRGTLQLPPLGVATTSGGFNSNTLDFQASSFRAGNAAVNQLFRWQAEPVGNNTSSPSGKFNLLFASGTSAPAETGLSIASSGIIGFVNLQPFGVVNPGTGLIGGGTVTLGAPITLNVNESVVAFQTDLTAGITTAENFATNAVNGALAQAKTYADADLATAKAYADTDSSSTLAAAKTYADSDSNAAVNAAEGYALGLLGSGDQALKVAKISSANPYQIGGTDVLKADLNENTATGFNAISPAITGIQNTAHGKEALKNATTASKNTAHGYQALLNEISGNNNIAHGHQALKSHTAGDDNTVIGTQAGLYLLTGGKNILLGKLAGQMLKSNESKEILINHDGVTGESNAIHIGNDVDQLQAYIAGIYETDHSSNPNALHVLIDKTTGLLGVDTKGGGTTVASISTGSGLLVNGGSGPASGADTLTVDTSVIATNAYADADLAAAKAYADSDLAQAKAYADGDLTQAKAYADSDLTQAKAYADSDLTQAKAYADTDSSQTLTAAKAYANGLPFLPLTGGTLTGSLTGTTANFGAVTSAAVISAGPTFTSNNGCTETSLTGGATAGSFASGVAGTCTLTITMGTSATAPNGWACHANDLTTNANSASWSQTATTTTTVTLSGTTASGDVVNFACIGY